MQDHLDKVACCEEGGRGCGEQARSRSLISESATLLSDLGRNRRQITLYGPKFFTDSPWLKLMVVLWEQRKYLHSVGDIFCGERENYTVYPNHIWKKLTSELVPRNSSETSEVTSPAIIQKMGYWNEPLLIGGNIQSLITNSTMFYFYFFVIIFFLLFSRSVQSSFDIFLTDATCFSPISVWAHLSQSSLGSAARI